MTNNLILKCINKLFIENEHILVVPESVTLKDDLLKVEYYNYFFVIDLKDYLELFKSIDKNKKQDWIKNHLLIYIWDSIFEELNKKEIIISICNSNIVIKWTYITRIRSQNERNKSNDVGKQKIRSCL